MFNSIIQWSLRNKGAVLVIATLLSAFGIWSLATMKVDILPDINKPTVTVFAESPGMAAEDVERLILRPMESAVLGAFGVERVRGSAGYAQATLSVEFAWGTDTLRNRQIVSERLAQALLPKGVVPTLGPSTSLLGEIMWVGVTAGEGSISPMELRTLADFTILPALLRVPGVASVLVMGGDVREWQINLNAERMRREGIMLSDVRRATENALVNKGGNVLVENGKEYPIRIIVADEDITSLGRIAVSSGGGAGMKENIVRLADIARVEEGPSPIRGSALVDGKQGVILRIIRQPDAETLTVTDEVDRVFHSLASSMPAGVTLHSDLFRQESFIRAGLGNVTGALRDGTLFVVLILILFLANTRITFITLSAIPLSILVTAIVFKQFGLSVNVMTLGGIAVAVGELVDDAIVGVENVFRRLHAWSTSGEKGDRESVIFVASSEVRNSIVYATILVAVVFLPLFFVEGVEGRLIASLGAAYLVSLIASMVVSLTVTPVLSALLLHERSLLGHEKETTIVLAIKNRITPWIRWCIEHIKHVTAGIAIALLLTVFLYVSAGKEGIPPFNEGSAVIMLFLPSGTALETTNAYVGKLAGDILRVPGVRQVGSIAGRAVADPHGGSVNSSEVQIAFEKGAFEKDRTQMMRRIQEILDRTSGADFSLGQPITHRVEMLLSGVRAPIVVKVFGDDEGDMERVAKQVVAELAKQPGITNPRIAQNVVVPEFRIYVDRDRLSEAGLSAGEVAEDLEMGLMGDIFGDVRLGGASVPVVARFDAESRGSMASLRDLALPFPSVASLGSAADVRIEGGRNSVDHEGGKRVLTVSANYGRSDVVGAVEGAKVALEKQKLPTGVTLSFEGNYKSQKESSRRLTILFVVATLLILGVLYHAFRSLPLALLVMANIPTVFIGGMIGVWLTGGTVSLAHLVGFISLAGIVSRNGIMLIGRAITLVRIEGESFSPETIIRATLERVTPVLMTSLVTALALIPLLLSGDESGKEMLHPLAVVIFGGLVSSTVISLFLTPALLYRFGGKAISQKETSVSGF